MSDMQYVVTGMVRSGSTVTWQILDYIVRYDKKESGLLRAHGCIELEDDFIVFACYRDFRDVVISIAKIYNLSISQATKHTAFTNPMKGLLQQKQQYWNHPRCHFIKYEDYFPNKIPQLVAYIYKATGIHTSHDLFEFPEYKIFCELIAEKFSLEKAKIISNKYKTFDRVDPKSMIHGNHITSGGNIGNWKNIQNAKDAGALEALKPSLEEFGYEN